MTKRQLILDQELVEFRASYAAERPNYPSGWVPGRKLFVTGFMLWELAKAGLIQENGCGEYRP